MIITFPCGSCGSGIKAQSENGGSIGRCPRCGERVRIPQADVEEPKPTDGEPVPRSRQFGSAFGRLSIPVRLLLVGGLISIVGVAFYWAPAIPMLIASLLVVAVAIALAFVPLELGRHRKQSSLFGIMGIIGAITALVLPISTGLGWMGACPGLAIWVAALLCTISPRRIIRYTLSGVVLTAGTSAGLWGWHSAVTPFIPNLTEMTDEFARCGIFPIEGRVPRVIRGRRLLCTTFAPDANYPDDGAIQVYADDGGTVHGFVWTDLGSAGFDDL